MRRVSHLLLHPLIQSHRRETIPAHPHGLAIGLIGTRRTLHQPEYSPCPGRDVRDRSRPQPALGGRRDHALVNLDRRQPRIQRIPLAAHRRELLVPLGLRSPQPVLDDFVHLAALELLRLFEPLLLLGQLAHLVRINALETFLLLRELIAERDVVRTELLQLRLVRRPIHIQRPRPVALDIVLREPSRDFILRFELELQCHNPLTQIERDHRKRPCCLLH